MALASLLAGEVVEEAREYHHRQTQALDPDTGQGEATWPSPSPPTGPWSTSTPSSAWSRWSRSPTTQDVGKAINPQAVEGQIEGGIAQGLGLALMEEIQVVDGEVRNPSFTDYLIPTVLDMPLVRSRRPGPGPPRLPYGLRGIGEPPTISSTPAIVAAIRAASGRPSPGSPSAPSTSSAFPPPSRAPPGRRGRSPPEAADPDRDGG